MAARRLCGGGLVRRLVAGQPLPETHPELLRAGELMPGISAAEFALRRQSLAELLPPNSFAILPAAHKMYMTGVIPYPYRQDADFTYLTGIQRPAVAVIGDHITHGGRYTLFVEDPSPERERWDGACMTPEAAVEHFGADEAFYMYQMSSRLAPAMAGASSVLFDTTRAGLQRLGEVVAAVRGQGRLRPLRELLHQLRWRKSVAEVSLIRSSVGSACSALRQCVHATRPGVAEHVLAATFEYLCKVDGASGVAYPPVVASGADACTIHYGRNDKLLQAGQLLLMDAGCERHGYVSDVTRTWPVDGTFSGPQRDVYQGVLEVHRRCLSLVKPGATLRSVHNTSIALISDLLRQLGVCGQLSTSQIAAGCYRDFYLHSVGHWMGLDVHDTSSVSHDRALEPGVVLTVEPGVYIPDDPHRFGQYAGIGVRLEDDVLVTETGHEVLSAQLPLEVKEVEEMVQRQGEGVSPPCLHWSHG